MNVILILLAASLLIAISFLVAFIWSVKSGQYEDDYTPSVRILFDDNYTPAESAHTEQNRSGAELDGDILKTKHTK